jgi:hypothetical protein
MVVAGAGYTDSSSLRSVASRRPFLVLNPRSDEQFVAFAYERLRAGPATSDEFQAALRAKYPRALVRERGLSAEAQTWYVYREGTWVANDA